MICLNCGDEVWVLSWTMEGVEVCRTCEKGYHIIDYPKTKEKSTKLDFKGKSRIVDY